MITDEIIKQNLKKVLEENSKKLKKTQKSILEKANINQKLFVLYMGKKNRKIPAKWIASICEVLNVSTDEVLKTKKETKWN